jgi:uncharacterized membrane protein YphA (DoxX/SURF4 family)
VQAALESVDVHEENEMSVQNRNISSVVLRLGLGLGFLSAVADRFGLWGPFGERNVEWGNYSKFLDYTQTLNAYWPTSLIPTLGAVATGAEILFGLLVLIGWHTRIAARLAGGLLIVFATTMTISLGFKSVLNFAVLTGIGGSFLLANCDSFPFSLDELLSRRTNLKVTSTDVPTSPVAD